MQNKKLLKHIVFIIIIISCIISWRESQIEEARKEGYDKGISEGKSKATKDFESKMKSQRESLEAELKSQANKYESELAAKEEVFKNQVKTTYNNSHAQGKDSMAKDVDEIINRPSKKKSKKKNWNDIE